jgi:hypothetical protein
MGISSAHDRLYGRAGQQPTLQVTGSIFTSPTDGGFEIGSVAQYYANAGDVAKDVANYSRANFGTCFALSSAQLLVSTVNASSATVLAPSSPLVLPTFAPGWRRAGVSVVTLPNLTGTFHLVSALAIRGNEEVSLYAMVGSWPAGVAIVTSAMEAVLARMSGVAHVGAA